MAKTFDQYKAEHTHEPFPLPMPDGTAIPLKKGSYDEEKAALAAVAADRAAGELTMFSGLEAIVGDEVKAKIAAAWGALPPEAWQDAMKDRAEHFGEGNSPASPAS